MVLASLSGDVVGTLDSRAAGVVVVEIPCDDDAVFAGSGMSFDDASGTEVGPGEFLFAGPCDLHGSARGFGQTRRFDGRLSSVLAAIARPCIGDDHAHIRARHLEGLRDLVSHAEGALGAGPDGELIAVPLGYRGAWFEGSVRDVGDMVGGLH